MSELWNVRAEIMVQPEDFASGDTLGFMNIVTWANSAETAQEKIEHYFKSFDWHIVGVEQAKVLDVDHIYEEEEFQGMIERVNANPEAIICGTFHSYKVN
jgi:hypothetical protein